MREGESTAQSVELGDAKPMRIAILTETFLPKIDGIVTRLCHTIRHLREFGHEVMIIAPKGITDFEGTPVTGVSGFPFPLYPELKLAIPRPSVGIALGEFQPDVIHAVNPFQTLSCRISWQDPSTDPPDVREMKEL